MPRSLILDRRSIRRIEREIGYPVVIKIPDGAFSRGVFKANSAVELAVLVDTVFKDTDLIIAQEYMQTAFDWRVGVIDRKPLFVCQYFMARDHWQIVNHHAAGAPEEGRSVTLPVEQAPPHVIEIATRAASLIGNGLYGVDLKETTGGVFVIEINDNPSIDSGVEDEILKDDLYRIIVGELVRRIERRMMPDVSRNNGSGTVGSPGLATNPARARVAQVLPVNVPLA
jgi:glutathione synthase/RimK-type ligase-like ATP-grasp enzyme